VQEWQVVYHKEASPLVDAVTLPVAEMVNVSQFVQGRQAVYRKVALFLDDVAIL